MKRLSCTFAGLVAAALVIAGCANMGGGGPWTTLVDGEKGLENFNRIGDANWRAEGGAIVADKGKGGHLVSKKTYTNFQIRAEFWVDTNTNSGIFIRASDPNKIGSANAYEVNIYDQRAGQEYATGAIVGVGRIPVPNPPSYKAAGKWNTMVITARDTHLVVQLNGIETTTVYDSKFPSGYFSLQYGMHGKLPGGPIKWRKVEVREL